MAVSISHLGYRKLSRVIFEWQAADRASLLALFVLIEVTSHWLWCVFVWWRQDLYGSYVDMGLLYPLWTGVTLMLVFFFWMVSRTSPIRTDTGSLYKWQAIMITLYSLYIAVVILVMGHRSEEHTSELQSRENLVCRLLLEKKNIVPTDRMELRGLEIASFIRAADGRVQTALVTSPTPGALPVVLRQTAVRARVKHAHAYPR